MQIEPAEPGLQFFITRIGREEAVGPLEHHQVSRDDAIPGGIVHPPVEQSIEQQSACGRQVQAASMPVPYPHLSLQHLPGRFDVTAVAPEALGTEVVRHPEIGDASQTFVDARRHAFWLLDVQLKTITREASPAQLSPMASDLQDFEVVGFERPPVRLDAAGKIDAEPLRGHCQPVLLTCVTDVDVAHPGVPRQLSGQPFSVGVAFSRPYPNVIAGPIGRVSEHLVHPKTLRTRLDQPPQHRIAIRARQLIEFQVAVNVQDGAPW